MIGIKSLEEKREVNNFLFRKYKQESYNNPENIYLETLVYYNMDLIKYVIDNEGYELNTDKYNEALEGLIHGIKTYEMDSINSFEEYLISSINSFLKTKTKKL